MSKLAVSFDPNNPPATTPPNTFNAQFAQGGGKMVVWNQSNQNLLLAWGSGTAQQEYCPAETAVLCCVMTPSANITWSIESTVQGANSPISRVTVITYAFSEPVPGTYPAPIDRTIMQTNAAGIQATSGFYAAENVGNSDFGVGGQTGKITYLAAFQLTGDKATANTGRMTITGLVDPISGNPITLPYWIDQSANGTTPIKDSFSPPLATASGQDIVFTFPAMTAAIDIVVQYAVQ